MNNSEQFNDSQIIYEERQQWLDDRIDDFWNDANEVGNTVSQVINDKRDVFDFLFKENRELALVYLICEMHDIFSYHAEREALEMNFSNYKTDKINIIRVA